MTEHGTVRYGSSDIRYEVVRSRRRRKTLQLTVDGASGVVVAAPASTPIADIDSFVRKRASWIIRNASDATLRARAPQFRSGESLPYLGRQVQMVVENSSTVRRTEVRFRHWTFEVAVPSSLCGDERQDAMRTAFVSWYRKQAERRLRHAVERWSSVVGHEPSRVLIRDQKRRWGSCSADRTLRFNWRSVLLDPTLMDYVVVHELAHLSVKNHSREFWALVLKAMPDAERRRQKIREVGAHLPL